jgi:hypothetical protein
MNEQIQKLIGCALDQAVPETWTTLTHDQLIKFSEKFALLIIQECAKINKEQSYELGGVIVDVEEGSGFDTVCLNTVKRVERYLSSYDVAEHFGIQESA